MGQSCGSEDSGATLAMNQRRSNALLKRLLLFYRSHGRKNLPWRKVRDPYRILVSEVMLQQTQVKRVIPKYKSFLKKFASIKKLAGATLGDVLREWQGLGYNRRAKMLHDAARAIVARHAGGVPGERSLLEALPGIGQYTAGAIRVFAYNEPDDFLETNIRTALIHEFFPHARKVSDARLLKLLPEIRGSTSPRFFYSALMDYGAVLKARGVRAHRKSKHYTKQKSFKGSDREVRGAILRSLAKARSMRLLKFPRLKISKTLKQLAREGLIMRSGKKYFLPK